MYIFSDNTIEHLNYVLNVFKSACRHVDNRKDKNFQSATDYDTESLVSPQYFYYFQFREKYCQIERLGRSNKYTIRCHNFKPDFVSPYMTVSTSANEYQLEKYGEYDNFDCAVEDFAKICHAMTVYHQPVLLY